MDNTSNLDKMEDQEMSVVMCRMECNVDGNGLSHYIIYNDEGDLPY